jgi:hypothetical protein
LPSHNFILRYEHQSTMAEPFLLQKACRLNEFSNLVLEYLA